MGLKAQSSVEHFLDRNTAGDETVSLYHQIFSLYANIAGTATCSLVTPSLFLCHLS